MCNIEGANYSIVPVYKMLIFLLFFAVFQLKQKQEYQLKAKHFIPPQVRMIKVECIYCT